MSLTGYSPWGCRVEDNEHTHTEELVGNSQCHREWLRKQTPKPEDLGSYSDFSASKLCNFYQVTNTSGPLCAVKLDILIVE